ncbi:MAG: hypothetical protein FWE20_08425 [Defluviitaleaceae bacterium]|nr:hypothetical protein [Defluviitaleaceae bacterium]
MAYETKVLLAILARYVAKADTLEDAYDAIKSAANVDGMNLPTYEEMVREVRACIQYPECWIGEPDFTPIEEEATSRT